MDKKEIGLKLKELRSTSGLKWDVILARLKDEYGIIVARSTIYGYENGHGCPDPNVFLALCHIYGSDDVLSDFGYSAKVEQDFGVEELVLFEDEYSPENWDMIKNFIALIPLKNQGSKE